MAYTSSGFSGLTLTFQSAPDAAGVAGTWVTFAGTAESGSAAMTATTQTQSTFTGYYPWTRVTLSGLTGTGTVSGIFYGYRENPVTISSSGGGGAVPNPIKVVGPDANASPSTTDPVQIAGNDGTNVRRVSTDTSGHLATVGVDNAGAVTPGCNLQASFTATASGNTQIVAASGSTVIRICHITLASDTVQNLKLTRGTGASCGTGTADITGLLYNTTSLDLEFPANSALRGAASGAVCLSQSATGNAGGVVIYEYIP